MPFPPGTQVVRRDYDIIAALAIARYLTLDQLMRVVFVDRSERIARRRLQRLASPGPSGLDPLLRSVSYRGPSGAPLKAWALTEGGYVLAKRLVSYAPTPQRDVGAAFLEHTLLLNDVLVELLARGRAAGCAFTELPFRWFAESGQYASFEFYDRQALRSQKARIRPDATLEIGSPARRIFLECETGTHTIVSTDPTNTGATNAKIQRYTQFIAGTVGQHDPRTPYAVLCPDRLSPVLLFVVHSPRRRDAIRKLVSDPAKPVRLKVRAYTFTEAAEALGSLVDGAPVVASPSTTQVSAVDLELLERALADSRSAAQRTDALALLARLRGASGAGVQTGPATALPDKARSEKSNGFVAKTARQ
jgi:hypothetical protein